MLLKRAWLEYDQGKILELTPGKTSFAEELYAQLLLNSNQSSISGEVRGEQLGGNRWQVMVHPKQGVVLGRLAMEFEVGYAQGDRVFCNGYQSWTETREYGIHEQIPPLRGFAKKYVQNLGDGVWTTAPLWGWGYAWLRKAQGTSSFWGSLGEDEGFTRFEFHIQHNILLVEKQLIGLGKPGLELDHSYAALDIWTAEGSPEANAEKWLSMMPVQRPSAPKLIGWNSWYRYENKINPKVLLDNLRAFRQFKDEMPFETEGAEWAFQVDDGWQRHTGDWVNLNPAFGGGTPMKDLAQSIQKEGFVPGIWLAPFVASAQSNLYKKYPDWLVKGPDGQPLKIAYNPFWGGWYYALDFYKTEVQDYVRAVLKQVVQQWGYRLLKLDFLFAAAVATRPNRTSGQTMHDVMEFLRDCAGNARIIACGVPVLSARNFADYCRAGPDVYHRWDSWMLSWLRLRERPSARQAVHNSIARQALHQHGFQNDADVFIMRKKRQYLQPHQQTILLASAALLGGVFFTSDNYADYPPEDRARLQVALDIFMNGKLRSTHVQPDGFFEMRFEYQGGSCSLRGNLQDGKIY